MPAACRALAHLLEGGLVGYFEDDPAQPVFRQIVTSTRKSMGDNADAIYYDAAVSSEYAYRVRGRIAGAVYVSFTVEAGGEPGGFPERTAGVLNDTEFDVDEDGRFELFLGGAPRDRNWIGLAPTRVASRPGTTGKRRVARGTSDPRPRARDRGDRRPRSAPGPRRRVGRGRAAPRRALRAVAVARPDPSPARPTSPRSCHASRASSRSRCRPATHALAAGDASYSMAPYVLGPDEALVITGRWPRCRCANVTLWNRHLQTYDYAHRQVSLNRAQTQLEPDGSFRVVIAHHDPGVANWIDTEGRPFGMVFWRFFLPEGPIETPQARVVDLADVQNV